MQCYSISQRLRQHFPPVRYNDLSICSFCLFFFLLQTSEDEHEYDFTLVADEMSNEILSDKTRAAICDLPNSIMDGAHLSKDYNRILMQTALSFDINSFIQEMDELVLVFLEQVYTAVTIKAQVHVIFYLEYDSPVHVCPVC